MCWQIRWGSTLQPWHWTSVEFKEWGNATVLALVASGLGLGLYWQNSVGAVQAQEGATKTVLPIWLAQLIGCGCFWLFLASGSITCFNVDIYWCDDIRVICAVG